MDNRQKQLRDLETIFTGSKQQPGGHSLDDAAVERLITKSDEIVDVCVLALSRNLYRIDTLVMTFGGGVSIGLAISFAITGKTWLSFALCGLVWLACGVLGTITRVRRLREWVKRFSETAKMFARVGTKQMREALDKGVPL